MKIEHDWQPWQLRVLGLSLPWWLVLAPAALEWLWHLAFSSILPRPLEDVGAFCYALLPLGVLLALGTLCTREASHGSRSIARWFLLGAALMPPVLLWYFGGR